jgi:hypothetical protein
MKTKQTILALFITFFSLHVKAQTSVVLEGFHFLKKIQIEGDFLYFSDYQSLKKMDLTLENPPLITVVNEGLDSLQDFVIKDGILYIAHGYKISKVNISGPLPAPIIDVVTSIEMPLGLCFNGNDLYIASNGSIRKMDVTEANPSLTEVVSGIQGMVFAILVHDNYLYFSSTVSSTFPQQGISKVNLNQSPLEIETVFSGVADPKTFVMNGNELIFSELGNLRISSININQQDPSLNVILDIPLGAYGLAKRNNILYLVEFFGTPNGRILKMDSPLSVGSFNPNHEMIVYPNPAKDKIYFTSSNMSANYKIYNLLGQELEKGTAHHNEIDIMYLPNGNYFINIDGVLLKFIKK